jgi:FKBP-type peptidyl-prolyl cis-trans isomerase SlyD
LGVVRLRRDMEQKVVSFNYVLRDDSGEVLDSSGKENPITYLEGSGMIIDGLESALRSLAKGEKQKVSLAPEQAYGTYDESRVQTVDRSALPVDDIEVGAMFQAGNDHHAPVVRVVAIEEDKVRLDANHPLAGQRLHFEVEVIERRDATREEIDHGHVHGPGGHHHH